MPLYEYACDACRHKFEKIRKFSEPDANCDLCNQPARRLISVPSPAYVPGGTHAGYGGSQGQRIGDWPDRNEWIDQ